MTTHSEQLARLPVGGRRLWAGLLTAPAAWLVAEFVGYYMASRSCEPGSPGLPLRGFAAPRVAQLVLVLLMLAGAFIGFGCAVASWRALGTARDPRTGRERGDRDASPELGRARFMALAGVLVSVLFAGGVALFGVSAVLVNACSQAR